MWLFSKQVASHKGKPDGGARSLQPCLTTHGAECEDCRMEVENYIGGDPWGCLRFTWATHGLHRWALTGMPEADMDHCKLFLLVSIYLYVSTSEFLVGIAFSATLLAALPHFQRTKPPWPIPDLPQWTLGSDPRTSLLTKKKKSSFLTVCLNNGRIWFP